MPASTAQPTGRGNSSTHDFGPHGIFATSPTYGKHGGEASRKFSEMVDTCAEIFFAVWENMDYSSGKKGDGGRRRKTEEGVFDDNLYIFAGKRRLDCGRGLLRVGAERGPRSRGRFPISIRCTFANFCGFWRDGRPVSRVCLRCFLSRLSLGIFRQSAFPPLVHPEKWNFHQQFASLSGRRLRNFLATWYGDGRCDLVRRAQANTLWSGNRWPPAS